LIHGRLLLQEKAMKYHLFSKFLMLLLMLGWGMNYAPVWAHSKEVQIENVEVGFLLNNPVVLLAVGDKTIPIFVDPTVAGSIQGALKGEKIPRPFSHDLMQTILKHYGIRVDRVFITLQNGVFHGTITLSTNGGLQLFDSRSSDAIALAVHFKSPIFVERDLLETAGKNVEELENEIKNKIEI
jgi:uncharacterized protein